MIDIRGWSLDKIMQLPKECFGRTWPMTIAESGIDATPDFKIHPVKLPERIVIWEVYAYCTKLETGHAEISIALGNEVPTSIAIFNTLQKVFPEWFSEEAGQGYTIVGVGSSYRQANLRMPIETGGRRFVSSIDRISGTSNAGGIGLVISSIPRSIPEWPHSNLA